MTNLFVSTVVLAEVPTTQPISNISSEFDTLNIVETDINNVLIYQDKEENGKIKYLVPKSLNNKVVRVRQDTVLFKGWNGTGNTFNIAQTQDKLILFWKLDISGPNWLKIYLIQTDQEVIVDIEETDGANKSCPIHELDDCQTYKYYNDLLLDKSNCSIWIKTLLDLSDQNPCLPTADFIFNSFNDIPSTSTLENRVKCLDLVNRLDADDYRDRMEASFQLNQCKYIPTLLDLITNQSTYAELSPEQIVRIRTVTEKYKINLSEPLYNSLEDLEQNGSRNVVKP